MLKKLELLTNEGIDEDVLLWYRNHVGKHKKHMQKSLKITNDISSEASELLQTYLMRMPNYEEIRTELEKEKGKYGSLAVLPNGMIKLGPRIMKVGKFIAKYIDGEKLKAFNDEYSNVINKSRIVGTAVITNKLVDCLTSSEPNIKSCQNMAGDRWAATLIYYLCNNVWLGYIEDGNKNKLFRQWIYKPTSIRGTGGEAMDINCAIMGRPYPEDKRYGYFIRQMVAEHILKLPDKYNYMNMDNSKKDIKFHTFNLANVETVPYHDVGLKDISTWLVYPEESSELMRKQELRFEVELEPVLKNYKCLHCGGSIGSIKGLYGSGSCGCMDKDGCGMRECSSCHGRIIDGHECRVGEDVLCEGCYQEEAFACSLCGESYYNDNGVYINGEIITICEGCYKKKEYAKCHNCEEHFRDTYEVGGESYCSKCVGDARVKLAEKEEAEEKKEEEAEDVREEAVSK